MPQSLLRRLSVALCCCAALSCSSEEKEVRALLRDSDQMEIYALRSEGEPSEPGETPYLESAIVQRADVPDPDQRQRILDVVASGLKSSNEAMACFNPHHGIHMVRHDRTIDLVICFECESVHVYIDGKQAHVVPIKQDRATLDAEFDSLGVLSGRSPRKE